MFGSGCCRLWKLCQGQRPGEKQAKCVVARFLGSAESSRSATPSHHFPTALVALMPLGIGTFVSLMSPTVPDADESYFGAIPRALRSVVT
jgi:hypothetical protein